VRTIFSTLLTFCFTATDWFIGPRFVVTHRVQLLRHKTTSPSKEQAFNASGHCSVQQLQLTFDFRTLLFESGEVSFQ
jgi:hypothetical protein